MCDLHAESGSRGIRAVFGEFVATVRSCAAARQIWKGRGLCTARWTMGWGVGWHDVRSRFAAYMSRTSGASYAAIGLCIAGRTCILRHSHRCALSCWTSPSRTPVSTSQDYSERVLPVQGLISQVTPSNSFLTSTLTSSGSSGFITVIGIRLTSAGGFHVVPLTGSRSNPIIRTATRLKTSI